jgi:hypothetical protein
MITGERVLAFGVREATVKAAIAVTAAKAATTEKDLGVTRREGRKRTVSRIIKRTVSRIIMLGGMTMNKK